MLIFSILSLIAVGVSKTKESSRIFGSLIIVVICIEIIFLILKAFKNNLSKKFIFLIIKILNSWAYIFFFFILICGCIEEAMKEAFGNAVRILLLLLFESTGFICFIIFICTFIFIYCDKISDDDYFEIIFKLVTSLFRRN